jgi:hypothetical protein
MKTLHCEIARARACTCTDTCLYPLHSGPNDPPQLENMAVAVVKITELEREILRLKEQLKEKSLRIANQHRRIVSLANKVVRLKEKIQEK